ncbi:MAG: ABC transporter permease, partial [Desulfurococcales archaeon]|nr:ABC transporter permease [Desulfurococcales archaeon]
FTGRVAAGLAELGLMSAVVIASGYLLGARIYWSPLELRYWLVPLNFAVIGVTTIGLGVLMAAPARTSSGASSLAISLGLVLAFMTGVWFPKEWLPQALRFVADWFPVTVSLDVVRDIMVWGSPLEKVVLPTAATLAFGVGVIGLAGLVYSNLLRRMME